MVDENNEAFEVETSITLRSSSAGEIVLRSVSLGERPTILIEPEVSEDSTSMDINVDATDFESVEDLADFLELIVTILREGDKEVSM